MEEHLNTALCNLDRREKLCADDLLVYVVWHLEERGYLDTALVRRYEREAKQLARKNRPRAMSGGA